MKILNYSEDRRNCANYVAIVFRNLPDSISYSLIDMWPVLLMCSSTSERKRKFALHSLQNHIEFNTVEFNSLSSFYNPYDLSNRERNNICFLNDYVYVLIIMAFS